MHSEESYQKEQENFILTCLFLDKNDISLYLYNYIEIWISYTESKRGVHLGKHSTSIVKYCWRFTGAGE